MNAFAAGPGVACGEVSLATAGITTTTRVAATTRNRPAPARRMTRQAARPSGELRARAGDVPRCPATDPARHPMQPASNMGTPCSNITSPFSTAAMKKNMASTGAIMAARMGQSARNLLPLFRATKNWQTARYRATAMQPARTSWIEFFPDTSKGSAPMINTKGESKPRTTESTILPIRIPVLRPEISSRASRKSFRNPYKSPTKSAPPACATAPSDLRRFRGAGPLALGPPLGTTPWSTCLNAARAGPRGPARTRASAPLLAAAVLLCRQAGWQPAPLTAPAGTTGRRARRRGRDRVCSR